MRKCLKLIVFCTLPFYISNAQADINSNALIKVTKDNNPECIEFYTYKNELYCSTTPSSSTVVDPRIKDYEKQFIVFDNRPWQAVWGKQDKEITTVEYVPAGDEIENWQELVTSQFIPDIQNKISPRQYVDAVIQQLKSSGFQPQVDIIKDTPEQVLFEFRIASPVKLRQDELQIITKGKDGFYIVHYVTKKADMGKENKDKWLGNLEKAKIK